MPHATEGVMDSGTSAAPKTAIWQRVVPWLITVGCFAYLYSRLERAAEAQGSGLFSYLAAVFERVSWPQWLALMIPYSIFFFMLDSLVLWRVVNWFNARLDYKDIIPIRASSYILSIVNEQVSKGAMALYLKKRAGVPGWEVGSSMIFIMFCEFSSLLIWATVGVFLQWDRFPAIFHLIPWIALAAVGAFTVIHLYFSGRIWPDNPLRERPIFSAFRRATLRHYGVVIALRAPLMLTAVVIYTLALRLFGVTATFMEMLGYLAVIFFGASTPGPMRSVAILLWVILFPDRPAEMATFGFVQHNFFILFNAAIGLVFLRRAMRELSLSPSPRSSGAAG
jgi:hypothetical protein